MGFGSSSNLPEADQDRDPIVIALDQVLAAANQSDEGLTRDEIKGILGCGLAKARDTIRQAVEQGVLEVGRKYVPRHFNGRPTWLTVYRAKGEE